MSRKQYKPRFYRELKKLLGQNMYLLPICAGEITERRMTRLWQIISALHNANPSCYFVLPITTDGGDPNAAVDFYTQIRSGGVNLVTVAIGHVYSAGLIVLATGKKRYVAQHTQFHFHNVKVGLHGDFFAHELRKEAEDMEFLDNQLLSLLAENLKISKRQLRQMANNETSVNANDARRIGLVHQII